VIRVDDATEATAISAALVDATPWFLQARVRRLDAGWEAVVRLDPHMATARAEQQGLKDGSLRAALAEEAVRRTLDAYVARVNRALAPDARIASYAFDIAPTV
jgi:hypothetical protein